MTSEPVDPSSRPFPGPSVAGPGSPPEALRLLQAFDERFAPHLDSAAVAVREAEQALATARRELAHAQEAAESQPYVSDPLVFMRASLEEEVDGLKRKTTPKKVQASYRYLLARAVELAAGEVQGYHADRAALANDREHGVEACRQAERDAVQGLEAARQMQHRVRSAERVAREGLQVTLEKGMFTE